MRILMIVIMFFLIGAFFIISQNNLPLNSSENADKFISIYKVWLDKTFSNFVSLTGHVVEMKWLPD